jgi:hypothetical protein
MACSAADDGATGDPAADAAAWAARSTIRVLVTVLLVDLVFLQHGRLPDATGPSVRMWIYAATLLITFGWVVALAPAARRRLLATVRPWLATTAALLGVAVPVMGTLVALGHGIPWRVAAADADGHLFHLVALPLAAALTPADPGWLLRSLTRIVCLLCLAALLTYAAAVASPIASHAIETFLRTRELGFLNEFTDGRPYRLFLKSYVLVLVVFAMAAQRLVARRGSRGDWLVAGLTGATLWNSYTRSIWAVAAGLMVVWVLLEFRGRAVRWLLPTVVVAAVGLTASLPAEALWRLRLDDRDGTIAMRFGQVHALWEGFLARPLLGAGFGAATGPGGGFSVELDLLNLLRKIGLVGLLAYVAALWRPASICLRRLVAGRGCPEEVALCVATAAAVFGLGAANPYATASLGIGAIAIALATLSATTDPGVARSRLIR